MLFAAVCIAVWAAQTGIGKAVAAADKAVRPQTFAAGRAEAHTALSIDAPAARADLLARIVNSANPLPAPPAIVPGLYIKPGPTTSRSSATGAPPKATYSTPP